MTVLDDLPVLTGLVHGRSGTVRVHASDLGTSWVLGPGPEADVVITALSADLHALDRGEADGALLHLAGRLQVEGDAALLLELAAPALIDPAALDPEAVSAAIAGVPTAHLDAVMAGGFRALVLGEVFRRLPEFLDAEKAARARVSVGFDVGGRPDGGIDRYVVRVESGRCTVEPDPAGELAADVTLVLDGSEFLRLVLGHLNPVRAVLGGQVKVRGELMKALAFNAVMRIPGS